MQDLPEILTVQEAAKFLRLKRSTAYELVRQGVIPSMRLGRQIRIPKAGIEKLIARSMQDYRYNREKIHLVPSGLKGGHR